MAEFRIATDRLILREWRKQDVAPFMRRLNTPTVTRWLGGVQLRADFEASYERMTREQRENGHCFWIIERAEDAAILGFCGARVAGHPGTNVHGKIELGWRLGEDVWGCGYAKEAALAAIEWCWTALTVDELIAYTVPQNAPSWGLMERIGMNRRNDLDFLHPAFKIGHELSQHITYSIARPRSAATNR